MISSKIKDIKLRKSVAKKEQIKKIYKFVFRHFLNKPKLTFSERASIISFFIKKQKKIKTISKVQLVNRCVLNNRNRAVLRPYGVSRVVLRDMIQFGTFPGFEKAVW